MKILNFGSCNIDYVYAVDHIAAPGETLAADGLNVYCGGKGLNQSIALARAGAAVSHAGCVGPDGAELLKLMSDSGVDVSPVGTVAVKTGHAMIQVDGGGANSILVYGGANRAVTKEKVDSVLGDFSEGDFLILQNEISELRYIIDRAKERGMKIFLNPSPFDQTIGELPLRDVYCIILNETEALRLCGSADPAAFARALDEKYPGLKAVLTLGEAGSVWIDGGVLLRQNAFCVPAVDTTAAGDTFTGYFVASLASGDSPGRALRVASAAAAISVSRAGAAPSIPYISEVRSALTSMTEYRTATAAAAQAYLSEHLSDATLSGLADRLGYSKSYASSWIKSNLGARFCDLLRDKRCERCAELLESTDLPVSAVIEACGYKNESFMRNAFVKRYGCTPREYRKKVKNHDS